MQSFDIIVAVDEKRGIGKSGCLPWSLPADMLHFKEVTTKVSSPLKINAVIMGRKTWESIPEKFRPLKNRINIVLTRNKDFSLPEGVFKVGSVESAMDLLNSTVYKEKVETVFVIGGESVYNQAIDTGKCQKIYLTQILQDFKCDAFFPEFLNNFKQIKSSARAHHENIEYYFSTYQAV